MSGPKVLIRSAGLGTAHVRSAAEYRDLMLDQTGNAAPPSGGMPMLVGMFSQFDSWTEIDSTVEGRFLERVAAGAFATTIKRDRSQMRILLNHGKDPYVGDKPLAPLELLLEEPGRGAFYGGTLFDASYNRDLVDALRAGQYGSSFRFQVVRESWASAPKRSSYNPNALPERTIVEARVFEMGPVTFPAYAGATAGVR